MESQLSLSLSLSSVYGYRFVFSRRATRLRNCDMLPSTSHFSSTWSEQENSFSQRVSVQMNQSSSSRTDPTGEHVFLEWSSCCKSSVQFSLSPIELDINPKANITLIDVWQDCHRRQMSAVLRDTSPLKSNRKQRQWHSCRWTSIDPVSRLKKSIVDPRKIAREN